MKPEDLDFLHPCYDEFWMARFIQDTPGLGGWAYHMADVVLKAIKAHVDDGEELNYAVRAPNPPDVMPGFVEYIHMLEEDDDEEDDVPYWNYHKIVLALETQLQSTLAKMGEEEPAV